MTFSGQQLLLDCHNSNRALIQERINIENFMDELVCRTNLQATGKPIIEHSSVNDPEQAGYTAVQLLVSSSIVAHFVISSGDIYLDVFSCQPFDHNMVKLVVQEYFKPTHIRCNFMTR